MVNRRADLSEFGRQTGLGEEVLVVEDRLRADVGAVADDVPLRVGCGLFLPVEPTLLQIIRNGGEQVGVLHQFGRQSISTASMSLRPPLPSFWK